MRLKILLFFLFYFKTVFNDTLCPQQSFEVSYNEQITVSFIPNCELFEYPSSTVITIRPTTTNDVSVNTATNYPIDSSFIYTAPRDGTNPTFTLSYVLYFNNVRNNTLYNIIFKNNPCYLTCMSCNYPGTPTVLYAKQYINLLSQIEQCVIMRQPDLKIHF